MLLKAQIEQMSKPFSVEVFSVLCVHYREKHWVLCQMLLPWIEFHERKCNFQSHPVGFFITFGRVQACFSFIAIGNSKFRFVYRLWFLGESNSGFECAQCLHCFRFAMFRYFLYQNLHSYGSQLVTLLLNKFLAVTARTELHYCFAIMM